MIDINVEPYCATIVADSISPADVRLTTMVVNIPRFELPAFNTHRVFSRNSASSRAIPVERRIKMVEDSPYIPLEFGKNKAGMQPESTLEGESDDAAREAWRMAAGYATLSARRLAEIGAHKQLANRLLEPFLFQPVLVTATEWDNFFALRLNKDAQAEIRLCAEAMHDAMAASTPDFVGYGEWHLPIVTDDERLQIMTDDEDEFVILAKMLSTARCARISYLTHGGVRSSDKDFELHDNLLARGHMSPFEHAARPLTMDDVACGIAVGRRDAEGEEEWWAGNFRGWVQYRKEIPGEAVFGSGKVVKA